MKRKNNSNKRAIPKEFHRPSELELLKQLTEAYDIKSGNFEKILSQLEEMYGIKKENHCKHCIFQKMCSKFAEDGRNSSNCGEANRVQNYRELFKEIERRKKRDGVNRDKYDAKYIAFNGSLQFWNDTQEQLDKRFILS